MSGRPEGRTAPGADAGENSRCAIHSTGCAHRGAPEWSLREPGNPRLRIVAELGFRYDSSLAPCVGSGRRSNPRKATRLQWADGLTIDEAPPLTFGGSLQPPLWTFDRPRFRGGWQLDPGSRVAVAEGLRGWPGSIVLVSHDAQFVRDLEPDRVLLMPEGTLDHWGDDYLELVELA